MNRVIYFLLFVIISFSLVHGQNDSEVSAFINQCNIKIPIYSSPLCIDEKKSIFQDSIFEQYYSVKLISESAFAFEVEISSASQFNSPKIRGWLEKKYCSVFLSGRVLKLFESPNKSSSSREITLENDIVVNVIEIISSKDIFIKVAFIKDEKMYYGWVDNYCGNIYNSCN